MEQHVAAEQRANAVAKLRRAASLPRMKDGRRPPMHGETVSEGERTQTEDDKGEDRGEPPPEEKLEAEGVPDADEKAPISKPTDGPLKRRRSRSRSRGSKDLKAKMRAIDSPSHSGSPLSSDGAADELGGLRPRSPQPDSPFLVSPAPSPFLHMQMSPTSHMSPFPHGVPSSPTPMPTLEALQSRHLQGLFRSNSAAARIMAMHKLTGGTEPLESMMSSASSSLNPAYKLGRNNTVSGGERVAARQLLLRRLNERIGQVDAEQLSDREETATPTTKSRKRRSRRKSSSSTVVDDRDLTSTSTNTPSATPAPLAADLPPPPEPVRQTVRSTPSPHSHSPTAKEDAGQEITLDDRTTGEQLEYDTPLSRRGVIVEEEDDPPIRHTPPPRASRYRGSSSTPPYGSDRGNSLRMATTPDVPSTSTPPNDAGAPNGFHIPIILADRVEDDLPKSPFRTPIKEKLRDDDEEHVLYPAESDGSKLRFPWTESTDREISWVADPVPEAHYPTAADRQISWIAEPVEVRTTPKPERDVSWVGEAELNARMPIHDEDEDDSDDDAPVDSASTLNSSDAPGKGSPRQSSTSQDVVVEVRGASRRSSPSADPSQSSSKSTVRESDASSIFPGSVANGMARSRSQSSSMRGWDESQLLSDQSELAAKRSGDGSTSTWGRVKGAFSRSGSSAGRRSRTNSIVTRDKRENTESSRESGASLISGRRESKGDNSSSPAGPQTQTPITQSPSASASILSLTSPPRGGVSPIPPPTDADSAKYANPKLFPFPGMVRLQEESLRTRGMSISASTPDIVLGLGNSNDRPTPSSSSSTSGQSPESSRDRRLSHQASDTRLLARFQTSPAPPMSTTPSNTSQPDYFNIVPPAPPSASTANFGLKLPTTREGVKKWLNAKKFFSSQNPVNHNGPVTQPAVIDIRAPDASKKPSLSDLIARKDVENISDWEDADKPRAPTSASTSTIKAESTSRSRIHDFEVQESSPDDPMTAYTHTRPFPPSSYANGRTQQRVDVNEDPLAYLDSSTTPLPSPADLNSSTTPDPASSADESPGPSLSQSSRASNSSLSLHAPDLYEVTDLSLKSAEILQRLDHVLRSEDLNRMWASAISSPPRRLLLSSPMLQVVNSNTVKDRFLFLFTDLLVIAKPIIPNRDSLIDGPRQYPPDRKFVIKSVVQLKDLRLNVDREESNQAFAAPNRPPAVNAFIHDFALDPEAAVSKLLQQQVSQENYNVLGRLLVQLPELNKARLGEYVSRRSSRHALKGYLDALGFTGMGIDMALRIFLLSIHIPNGTTHANALEYLLDTFAARWYEANAGIVAFDKDLAVRLVRAIVRLNEALHSTSPHDVHSSRHFVNSRDFIEAFRRHDPRGLVLDGTLEKIYTSVRHEKLCQARNPVHGRSPIQVVLKSLCRHS